MPSSPQADLSITQELNVAHELDELKLSKGRLVCVNPRVLGEASNDVIVELTNAKLRIGRAKSNDVVLDASGVSRNHAELSYQEQGWHIQDVGSSNGLFVNKSEVTQAWLSPGDVISIGAVHYKFSLDNADYVEDAAQQVSLFDVEKTLVLKQEDVRAEIRPATPKVSANKPVASNDKFMSWVFAAAIGVIVIITASLSFI